MYLYQKLSALIWKSIITLILLKCLQKDEKWNKNCKRFNSTFERSKGMFKHYMGCLNIPLGLLNILAHVGVPNFIFHAFLQMNRS